MQFRRLGCIDMDRGRRRLLLEVVTILAAVVALAQLTLWAMQ